MTLSWSETIEKYYVRGKRWASDFLYIAKYFLAVTLANAINNLVVKLADDDVYTTMVDLGYVLAVTFALFLLVYIPRSLKVENGHILLVIATVWLKNLLELLTSDFSIAVINNYWAYGTWTNVYVNWVFVALSIVVGVVGVWVHHVLLRNACLRMHVAEHPKLEYDTAAEQIDESITEHHAAKKEGILFGIPYRLSTPEESDDFTLDEGTTRFGARPRWTSLPVR